ncbi:MAG: RluA family pseudouridine synthase [Pseudobdellovibrio sp.]
MKNQFKKVPKKYQPRGYRIIYEDLDIIVGVKSAGFLTVAAKWNKDQTIHSALNDYIRKGNPRSNKCVFVVHRLDQATSGILIFAKSEEVMNFLKDNWKQNNKTYLAICTGKFKEKKGQVSSYLAEDEDYVVHSSQENKEGKLALTEYEVIKETEHLSLVKINLLTGRKNQIRVHMAELGHPVVGDGKYGVASKSKQQDLMLHSCSLEITHPFSKKRMLFEAPPPAYFQKMMPYNYKKEDQT